MRGRERERTQLLKLLVYSTNGHNPQDWASLELGAKNSAQGSYVVVGVQDLNHLVLFFSGKLARTWSRHRASRSGTGTLIWDANIA